ncbi:MAG: hypothetical protein EOO75_01535 [Myxococcales bacterium]|nr:MAG: hypothetical protein EOO75_01535 [Myxococcales bacterium]
MRGLLALAIVAAAALGAPAAGAQPRLPRVEGEPHLWVGGGPALMVLDRSPYEASTGPGLHLGVRAPLTDQFHLLAELQSGSFSLRRPAPDPCPEPPEPCEAVDFPYSVQVLTGAVGLAYVVDVTRLTPSFGALLGLAQLGAGDSSFRALQGQRAVERHLGLQLAGGLDYRLTERWSVGLALRLFMGSGIDVTTAAAQVQWAAW